MCANSYCVAFRRRPQHGVWPIPTPFHHRLKNQSATRYRLLQLSASSRHSSQSSTLAASHKIRTSRETQRADERCSSAMAAWTEAHAIALLHESKPMVDVVHAWAEAPCYRHCRCQG
jgi:hypothetical protein